MKISRVGAVFLALVGLTFLGQGIGLIPGSFMTGAPIWAVVGLVLLGLAFALFKRQ